jgi:hypothetical protein
MSMIVFLAAVFVGAAEPASLGALRQEPSRPSVSEPLDPAAMAPTDLDDVIVQGRRLEEMTRDFVNTVGAPARGRGLARWDRGICAGVMNLGRETSQYIVDRISTVALDLGLQAGAPGCEPNILIFAASEGNSFTRSIVQSRPRLFSGSGSGMDLGYAALKRFQDVDRPVRWWSVSAPIDSDNGQIAVRTRGLSSAGGAGPNGDSVMNFAPTIYVGAGSRLSTQIVDTVQRIFVIIDIDQVDRVSLAQLGDYLSMVTLAQIDPDAETAGYATVLNLFDDPTHTDGMTNWDRAYLKGLYDTIRTRRNTNSSRAEIVASIVNVRRDMLAVEESLEP